MVFSFCEQPNSLLVYALASSPACLPLSNHCLRREFNGQRLSHGRRYYEHPTPPPRRRHGVSCGAHFRCVREKAPRGRCPELQEATSVRTPLPRKPGVLRCPTGRKLGRRQRSGLSISCRRRSPRRWATVHMAGEHGIRAPAVCALLSCVTAVSHGNNPLSLSLVVFCVLAPR